MMWMHAVATVQDAGAAEVVRQALEEYGIPVEVRRLGIVPYFVTVTGSEFEVRVPYDRMAEAEEVLRRLAEEAGVALARPFEWSNVSNDMTCIVTPAGVREIVGPPPRPLSRRTGLLLALLVPVLGPLYAESPGLALASLLIHLPFFYELIRRSSSDRALLVAFWGLGRLVDVLGTMLVIERQRALAASRAEQEAFRNAHGGKSEHAPEP